jgi:hypothetical protein
VDYVLITHAVKDYEAWKQVFDDAAPMRQTAGDRALFPMGIDRPGPELLRVA